MSFLSKNEILINELEQKEIFQINAVTLILSECILLFYQSLSDLIKN